MEEPIVRYISDLPLMKVLRAFVVRPKPRHLRELATVCGLSPGGVSDILRRLSDLGVLEATKHGNRKCYSLNISPQELGCLRRLFALDQESRLKERAERFSQNAAEKLAWMDETWGFFREVKKERL